MELLFSIIIYFTMNGNLSPWQKAKQMAASSSSRRVGGEGGDVVNLALQGVRANAEAH